VYVYIYIYIYMYIYISTGQRLGLISPFNLDAPLTPARVLAACNVDLAQFALQ